MDDEDILRPVLMGRKFARDLGVLDRLVSVDHYREIGVVLISENELRTYAGFSPGQLTIEWGTPDSEGWYAPWITRHGAKP